MNHGVIKTGCPSRLDCSVGPLADLDSTRRRWFGQVLRGAAVAGTATMAAGLAGCASESDDATRLALSWFISELKRVGYEEKPGGVYATPPKPVSVGRAVGDALEAQIRDLKVTSFRAGALEMQDRDRGVRWRGQVFLAYEYREQYHLQGQPRGWNAWTKESSILSMEHRSDGQWTVTRVK